MLDFLGVLGSDPVTIIDALILWILFNFLKLLVNAICLIVWAEFWALVANATSMLIVVMLLVSKPWVRGVGLCLFAPLLFGLIYCYIIFPVLVRPLIAWLLCGLLLLISEHVTYLGLLRCLIVPLVWAIPIVA
jgi:hypothetical protein